MEIRKKILQPFFMGIAILLFVTWIGVPATAKAYATKTIKVVEDKSKTYAFSNKIKKVKKVSTNKAFAIKILSGKYRIKILDTDCNTTQAVQVYFQNGKTQKINLKTEVNYLNKIKAELKPMLANPDKGLRTALAQWEKKLIKRNSKLKYEFRVHRDYEDANGKELKVSETFTIDEILKTFTTSQKRALVLEAYCRGRMHYNGTKKYKWYYCHHRKENNQFKQLYNGTFKGVCSDGAYMGMDIGKAVGLNVKSISNTDLNHAWCIAKVTDKDGTKYWQSVFTTSCGYDLKNDKYLKKEDYGTLKGFAAILRTPSRTALHYLKRAKNWKERVADTPALAATIKCPGCTGKLSHSDWNPYRTVSNRAVLGVSPPGGGIVYHPHNGGGVIRFFDDDGNEWLDAPESIKKLYEDMYL